MDFPEKDTYKTIAAASEEVLYKRKNSKFFGYAFPVTTEEEIKEILERLRKEHFSARHWCYAYQIGTEKIQYRANDDGEPNNSAECPFTDKFSHLRLQNVLVVVVRYFGGVKLGVGGLISAIKLQPKWHWKILKLLNEPLDKHFIISFWICEHE